MNEFLSFASRLDAWLRYRSLSISHLKQYLYLEGKIGAFLDSSFHILGAKLRYLQYAHYANFGPTGERSRRRMEYFQPARVPHLHPALILGSIASWLVETCNQHPANPAGLHPLLHWWGIYLIRPSTKLPARLRFRNNLQMWAVELTSLVVTGTGDSGVIQPLSQAVTLVTLRLGFYHWPSGWKASNLTSGIRRLNLSHRHTGCRAYKLD
jgi:hypothetical protein